MSNRRPFCFAGTIVTWMAAIASLFLGTHGMGDATQVKGFMATAQEMSAQENFEGSLPSWRAAPDATTTEKDSSGELNVALGYRAPYLIIGNWL